MNNITNKDLEGLLGCHDPGDTVMEDAQDDPCMNEYTKKVKQDKKDTQDPVEIEPTNPLHCFQSKQTADVMHAFETTCVAQGHPHPLLVSVIAALDSSWAMESAEQLDRDIQQMKQCMAIEMDETDVYARCNMRSYFKKTTGQQSLFHPTERIEGAWFPRFLCDYFSINLLVIQNKTLMIHGILDTARTSILLHKWRGTYQIYSKDGSSLFSPAQIYQLCKDLKYAGYVIFSSVLPRLGQSRMTDLVPLAEALDIPTHHGKKRRIKKDIYADVSTLIKA